MDGGRGCTRSPRPDDGYSAFGNPEFEDKEMFPPLHIPPPMVNFLRWLAACIANFVHLIHGADVAGATALPVDVAASLIAQPAHSWGQLAQLASAAGMGGMGQLVKAIVAHPLITVTALWWVYETKVQFSAALKWLRRVSRRRRNRRAARRRELRRIGGKDPKRGRTRTPAEGGHPKRKGD